ncbi:integrase [Tetzosporium hominis]|uniref:Integrase n=1 Tax=Tetzosporium hominis TaxID=2020506 RepID=A0A264W121_9BACL|nr:IS21 family transposase [Tetzosporium hominis]OZS77288.1 integrase [Tetzosporium hominis]
MLTVTDIQYIRQEVNQKGRNYAEVARSTNHDERTVKKYADMEDWNEERPKTTRKPRVMGEARPIIDKWLEEDARKKKKFRRTAKRMFDMLVKDHGYEGSYRSIRDYVRKKKQQMGQSAEAALPLESIAGTAQVDFGEAPFVYRGRSVDLSYLVLSLPFSNTFYFQVFRSQNRECFLEGLKRIFHHLGGVPKTIRFDNLSPAVKKILPYGERVLTDEFERFVLHYGFSTEFCNPGSGNEKGHVEAMVKYIRNNFLLPEIHVADLERLNETFWTTAEEDRNRKHYQKDELLSELFKVDRKALLQLPEKSFECVRYEECRPDKYGLVKIDGRQYSTSPRFAKSSVLAKISYDTIEILTAEHESIIVHPRLYGEEKKSMKWQPYLELMAKRPMAIKYTDFFEQLPINWKEYIDSCTVPEKQEALRLLSVLLKQHDFSVATESLKIASTHGHPSAESIKQVFYQLINGRSDRVSLDIRRDSIPPMPPASRGSTHYDKLFEKGGVS